MKKIFLTSLLSISTLSLPVSSLFLTTSCSCSSYDNDVLLEQTTFETDPDCIIGYVTFYLKKELPSDVTINILITNNENNDQLTGNWTVNSKTVTAEIKLNISDFYKEQTHSFKIRCQFRNKKTGALEHESRTDFVNLVFKPSATKEVLVPNENLDIRSGTLYGFTGTLPSDVNTLSVPSNVSKIAPSAFSNNFPSNINRIILLSTISEVGDEAFANCSNVKVLDVSSFKLQPSWSGKNIFKNWCEVGTFIYTNETAYQIGILDFFYNKLPGAWTVQVYINTYIKDRSFSIIGVPESGTNIVYGTAWIISDSTKENQNDYKYWLATNWHVTRKFDTYVKQPYRIYYSDAYMSSPSSIKSDSYRPLANFSVESGDNFLFNDLQQYKNEHYIPGIDLAVINANFGDTPACQTKLDKLNLLQKETGHINQFDTNISSLTPKLRYTGGYPLKTSGCQWECNPVFSGMLEYKDWTKDVPKSNQQTFAHSISEPDILPDGTASGQKNPDKWYYWDSAPQYFCNQNKGLTWMEGGASGSMLIDQDYKICGIYWGGWNTENYSAFFPSFSIFSSSHQDFISKYL